MTLIPGPGGWIVGILCLTAMGLLLRYSDTLSNGNVGPEPDVKHKR